MRLMVTAAALAASASFAHAEVYVQESDRTDQASFFSDAVPGQFFSQRMADNFTLTSDTSVNQIVWWGGSQNFQFADLTNMASYTVEIYESSISGAPGATVYSNTVDSELGVLSIEATGETLAGGFGGGSEFMYTLDLTTDLDLTGGTQYWISVGATLVNGGGDAWVWSGSTMGDLVNATDFFDGSGYTVFDPTFNDLAFAIVPAPSSIALLGLGAFASGRRRR